MTDSQKIQLLTAQRDLFICQRNRLAIVENFNTCTKDMERLAGEYQGIKQSIEAENNSKINDETLEETPNGNN